MGHLQIKQGKINLRNACLNRLLTIQFRTRRQDFAGIFSMLFCRLTVFWATVFRATVFALLFFALLFFALLFFALTFRQLDASHDLVNVLAHSGIFLDSSGLETNTFLSLIILQHNSIDLLNSYVQCWSFSFKNAGSSLIALG